MGLPRYARDRYAYRATLPQPVPPTVRDRDSRRPAQPANPPLRRSLSRRVGAKYQAAAMPRDIACTTPPTLPKPKQVPWRSTRKQLVLRLTTSTSADAGGGAAPDRGLGLARRPAAGAAIFAERFAAERAGSCLCLHSGTSHDENICSYIIPPPYPQPGLTHSRTPFRHPRASFWHVGPDGAAMLRLSHPAHGIAHDRACHRDARRSACLPLAG